MREAITKLVKVVAGAALGYVAYCAVVLGEVALHLARTHYFDKEELLGGVISPIGGMWGYATGRWHGYPTWLYLRDLLAYVLVVCGVVLALRRKRALAR
jgi:hypothetical protein